MSDLKEKFKELVDIKSFYQSWGRQVLASLPKDKIAEIESKLIEAQKDAEPYTAQDHSDFLKLLLNGPEREYETAVALIVKFLRNADYNLGILMDNIPEQTAKDAAPQNASALNPLAQKYQLPNLQRLTS